MTRSCRSLAILIAAACLAGAPATAQTRTYTVGEDGPGWRDLAIRWVALDDTTAPGAIQPKELRPWENVMVGPGEATNIFGFQWHTVKGGLEALGRELGLNPRVWVGHFLSDPAPSVLDNDTTTAFQVVKVVPREEFNLHGSLTGSAFSDGFRIDYQEVWTFDLGFPLPIERIVFFPPLTGIDGDGVPLRRRAPQGFEVSVAEQPQDFLLLGSEPLSEQSPPAPLDHVILRTLLNSESLVELDFPLRPVRFVRINLGILHQAYTLAEFQVFGRGVPASVEYVSDVIDLGEPVNFGRIHYELRKLRRTADDELVDDPDAPVALSLQTRSGRDDTPQAYWVIDETGRDRPATKEQYQRADLPKTCCLDLRLPGMRSAITEDTEQWSTWSSPYDAWGQANRSADGRRYLQFRFDIRTDDPLAFGRLESLRFDLSSLLASDVVGEVALASAPDLAVISVPAGEPQRFHLDLRAAFEGRSGGFDAVRLGVPAGAAFLGLEMAADDGQLQSVVHDSVRTAPGQLTVFFPSNRVDADNNRLVRLVFETAVYNSTTVFTAEVFDTGSEEFPQSVDAGDANGLVASDALQVFSSQGTLPILSGLSLSSPVLTPNGDGANDVVELRFRLMAIEAGQVRLQVHDLSGRLVADLSSAGVLGRGDHGIEWRGLDEAGELVPPGVYVARLSIDTDRRGGERLLTVPVAY